MARTPRIACRSALSLLFIAVACTGTRGTPPPIHNANRRLVALVMRDLGITGDLYGFDPDGSGLQRLTTGGDMTVQFAFSPDGSSIAFAHTVSEYTWNIGVMSADGTGSRMLTHSPETLGSPSYISPSWLPDGSGIRYFRNDGNGPALGKGEGLWIVNPDSTGARHSNLNWDPFEVVWSPDGTRLAWEGNDGIYVEKANSTGHLQLTTGGGDFAPSWSPDGSQLVFVNHGAVKVVNADGTGERIIFSCGTACTGTNFPVWSPDGTKIAFTVESSRTHSGVDIMNADGSGLVSVPGLPTGIGSLAWQPIPAA